MMNNACKQILFSRVLYTFIPSAPYTAHRTQHKIRLFSKRFNSFYKEDNNNNNNSYLFGACVCVYVCGAAPARVLMYNTYKCSMYIIKQDLYICARVYCALLVWCRKYSHAAHNV